MLQFVRDLFSTPDNKHWEWLRVGSAVSLFSIIGAQFYALHNGQIFDPSSLGLGLTGVVTGSGVGIAMKDGARSKSVNVNINQGAQGVDNVG